jgi:hypothetical protein
MGIASRGQRSRRKRALIVAAGVALMAAAFAVCLLLRHGFDGLVHFFTTPTMEAGSGRKYTPVSGVRRTMEKLEEEPEPRK